MCRSIFHPWPRSFRSSTSGRWLRFTLDGEWRVPKMSPAYGDARDALRRRSSPKSGSKTKVPRQYGDTPVLTVCVHGWRVSELRPQVSGSVLLPRVPTDLVPRSPPVRNLLRSPTLVSSTVSCPSPTLVSSAVTCPSPNHTPTPSTGVPVPTSGPENSLLYPNLYIRVKTLYWDLQNKTSECTSRRIWPNSLRMTGQEQDKKL